MAFIFLEVVYHFLPLQVLTFSKSDCLDCHRQWWMAQIHLSVHYRLSGVGKCAGVL